MYFGSRWGQSFAFPSGAAVKPWKHMRIILGLRVGTGVADRIVRITCGQIGRL